MNNPSFSDCIDWTRRLQLSAAGTMPVQFVANDMKYIVTIIRLLEGLERDHHLKVSADNPPATNSGRRYYPHGSRLKSMHNLGIWSATLLVYNRDGRACSQFTIQPRKYLTLTADEPGAHLPDHGWLSHGPNLHVTFHDPEEAPVYFCNGCSTERVPAVGVVCDKCRAHAATVGHDGIEQVIATLKLVGTGQLQNMENLYTTCRDAAHYLENYWKKLGADNAATDVDAVIAERSKVYGDPSVSHANIGLEWTGIIQQHYGTKLDHPLPGWLVELMMVVFKCHRAARVFHQDNYTDAKAYLSFAEQDQQKARP